MKSFEIYTYLTSFVVACGLGVEKLLQSREIRCMNIIDFNIMGHKLG